MFLSGDEGCTSAGRDLFNFAPSNQHLEEIFEGGSVTLMIHSGTLGSDRIGMAIDVCMSYFLIESTGQKLRCRRLCIKSSSKPEPCSCCCSWCSWLLACCG